jgi:outer membrane protein assembly factor BamB
MPADAARWPIDPATGETLWTFREPHTERWARSTRQNWGKGVAYGEIDGRGVIYMTSPGYFLHALDAETGRPLEGFGHPIAVEGFGQYGAVDMLRYVDRVGEYDPYFGPDPADGYITTSHPSDGRRRSDHRGQRAFRTGVRPRRPGTRTCPATSSPSTRGRAR